MNNIKKYLTRIFQGIAIGIAAIIPGVSGGTLAVMFNIYDELIEAVAGIRKHFLKSIKTLLPLLIGALIGTCSIFFISLMLKYIPIPTLCLFAGLIIGGIPPITEKVSGQKIKWHYIVILIFSIVIAAGIGFLSVQLNLDNSFTTITFDKVLVLIGAGFLASCALIVPGISGSMLLLSLGLYTPIMTIALKDLLHFQNFGHNLIIIGCFAIGILIGFFVISKIMSYLLKKRLVPTYYGIIGFICGSLFAIFYNYDVINNNYYSTLGQWWQILLMVLFLIFGIALTYGINVYTKKNRTAKKE